MRKNTGTAGISEDAACRVWSGHGAADRSGNRSKRKLVFSATGVLVGTSLALLLGEVLIRVLNIAPDTNIVYRENFRHSDNSVLQYELVPGLPDGRCVINSAGLRDREFPLKKPEGVFRIVVLGDSVTFGFRVSQRQSYPKVLEALLNRFATPGSPRFEVLNLGVTGYNITQIVEFLRVRGLSYEPDLIVYGLCSERPSIVERGG